MKRFFILALIASCFIQADKPAVSLVLYNNTLKSVPLYIPGYMNPNLNPMSYSGVTLDEGQEIYFSENKKRYLLCTVTSEWQGDTIEMKSLLEQRKAELGL